MLNAIGIYSISQEKQPISYRKLQHTPRNRLGFFIGNPLSNLEKYFLPEISLDSNIGLFFAKKDDEFFYAHRINGTNFVIAVACRKSLDLKVEGQLLRNIEHIVERDIEHIYGNSDIIKMGLDTILENPYGYTCKDIVTGKILKDLDETKEILLQDIEKMLDRGEKLEVLVGKSIDLRVGSAEFDRSAKKMNRCC